MADWGVRVGRDQRSRHARRISRAAICRHDRRRRWRWRLRLIPAVEINSIADRDLVELGVELEEGELHILGYGVDPDDDAFEHKLAAQRDARMARLHMIIDRLSELDVPIDEQIAPALASEEAVGRPHIARAMVAAGHVETVQEAFDKWIDRNGPAYVPRQGMKSRAAIDAILDAGGIPGPGSLPGRARAAHPDQADDRLGYSRPRGLLPTLHARDSR